MKKLYFIASWCVLTLLGASCAYAHDSVVTIDSIGGIPVTPGNTPIVIPYLPYTLDINGTVNHDGDGGLNALSLWATDNGVYFFGPTKYFTGSGNSTTGTFSIPWTIASLGQHVITINAMHETIDGEHSVGCRAAPAIGADYLKSVGMSPLQNGENLIRNVARETGRGGVVWAGDKCAPDYTARTITVMLGGETE